jgi:predicted DNA-binding transcriptional regulator AlpA
MKSPRRRPNAKQSQSARSVRTLMPPVAPDPSQQTFPQPTPKYINKATVLAMIGKTWPTIWKWMQEDSFPRAFNTGGTSSWLESEVIDWMRNRPRQPIKGDDKSVSS